MRSLLLGLDVSPRRMGWGLVDLVSGEPVACGCEAIELPKNGWDRMPVYQALRIATEPFCKRHHYNGDPWGETPAPAYEIQAAYLEHPISRFPGMAYDEGRAVGMVHCEVQRRWPHAPVEYLKPSEWRLLAGLKGNASKADVWAAAFDLFVEHGFTLDAQQDAADALCLAIAGQRRNDENWSRAVARGDAA